MNQETKVKECLKQFFFTKFTDNHQATDPQMLFNMIGSLVKGKKQP